MRTETHAPDLEARYVNDRLIQLTYEVELQEGERLRLPDALVASVGPGRWLVSVQPCAIRDHTGFLNSYAPEDEGLYDAYPPR